MGNNIGTNKYQGEQHRELYGGGGGDNIKENNIGNFIGGTMPRRTT